MKQTAKKVNWIWIKGQKNNKRRDIKPNRFGCDSHSEGENNRRKVMFEKSLWEEPNEIKEWIVVYVSQKSYSSYYDNNYNYYYIYYYYKL